MNSTPTIEELAGAAPCLPTSGRLTGRVCWVNGGTSGIGRATALRMAAEGAAAVVVTGRREALGQALADEIHERGAEALFVAADATREDDVAAALQQALARFGRLDAVFNNAGCQERRRPLAEQGDEVYAQVFDTNVRALFHAMRHAIAAMLTSGGGTIVNNTSVSGIRNPNPGLSLYSASKAAANSLTRSAAMEYAPAGIRINAIAPGRVLTDMMLSSGIADMRSVAAGLPLRRMGHPEEVAAAVIWLMSDEASYVVGHVLAADGGFLAG
ncbi:MULTISPECIES: SDR family NAD(P)-dependent oxidoreductase [unclassified Rhizobacter]|uniref:SDR family NAD(P)-dependent oxidoreductase n=1 Tax=unclassified Rhizobacter TaxID=2640088 RepID=UPI0006FF6AE9|nr:MULTISPECIES: glucose 1-dehydrogenase [unclassified Rhizobacter]KQU64575.1 short-chain dehydrogenase [Rhizobacter sp. Root29]KQW03393.1 short-chain dehydrogenase [Rhizobacter sp. Root1238]KRB13725.1 short-chain dehydrogenase [Rhizobacter sp. Root16D2]